MTQKFPLWATLLTLLGLMILCTLGTWQIQRLEWKTQLLADMNAAYETDPATNPQTTNTLNQAAKNNSRIIHGTITGHFTTDAPLRSGPRPYKEQAGYHLYALFQMNDGGMILVNRGWMPADVAPPQSPTAPQKLAGLFRTPPAPNRFTPPNDGSQNYWFRFDSASIAAQFNAPSIAPYILYAEDADTTTHTPTTTYPPTTTHPLAITERVEINNNHRGYAFFWFAMAAALLGVYVLRFIVTARR